MAVAVPGATGQMGRTLLNTAAEATDISLTAGSRSPGAGPIGGVEIRARTELLDQVRTGSVDVVIDFTVPTATLELLGAAREGTVPTVIGTTGFEESTAIDAAAADIPVLQAANFAPAIQTLRMLLGTADDTLPEYDRELIEAHHNRKRDAPSGTAKLLLGELMDGDDGGEAVYGRHGDADRSGDEIGVHAVRGGTIAGRHEVVFAGDGETLTLTHRVEDRQVFARGALRAARWLVDRSPGQYSYAAVLADEEGSHGT